MNQKTLSLVLIAVGAALALFSGLGDVIGLGSEDSVFGWKQAVGIAVGAGLIAVGLLMRFRQRAAEPLE